MAVPDLPEQPRHALGWCGCVQAFIELEGIRGHAPGMLDQRCESVAAEPGRVSGPRFSASEPCVKA